MHFLAPGIHQCHRLLHFRTEPPTQRRRFAPRADIGHLHSAALALSHWLEARQLGTLINQALLGRAAFSSGSPASSQVLAPGGSTTLTLTSPQRCQFFSSDVELGRVLDARRIDDVLRLCHRHGQAGPHRRRGISRHPATCPIEKYFAAVLEREDNRCWTQAFCLRLLGTQSSTWLVSIDWSAICSRRHDRFRFRSGAVADVVLRGSQFHHDAGKKTDRRSSTREEMAGHQLRLRS